MAGPELHGIVTWVSMTQFLDPLYLDPLPHCLDSRSRVPIRWNCVHVALFVSRNKGEQQILTGEVNISMVSCILLGDRMIIIIWDS